MAGRIPDSPLSRSVRPQTTSAATTATATASAQGRRHRRRPKISSVGVGDLVAVAGLCLFFRGAAPAAASVASDEPHPNDKRTTYDRITVPPPQRLIPTNRARELLRRSEDNLWNRELRAASDAVAERRRRRRGNDRGLGGASGSDEAVMFQPPRRRAQGSLRGDTQNEYLPERDPETTQLLLDPEGADDTGACLSPLQRWFVSKIETMGYDLWEEMEAYDVASVTYLYKHYVSGADGTSEYFGVYGDRTAEMKANHANLQRFWALGEAEGKRQEASQYYVTSPSNSFGSPTSEEWGATDVVLLGMHGADLAEKSKLVPTLQQMYDLDMSSAFEMAKKIQDIVARLPGAFNNPMLTANAIAIQSMEYAPGTFGGVARDTVVIGDGVFSFLEWLDLAPDGPDYIHAHEFGHHLQYDLGVSDAGAGAWTEAEETRRFEMMADAFGSYYLGHAQGDRMEASRLYDVHRAAYSLGDCEDSDMTHHGTPRQRECASNFGANLALPSYVDGGHVVPPAEFRRLFDKKLESMLALDEWTCEPVVDASVLDANIYGEGVEGGGAGGSGDPQPVAAEGGGNPENDASVGEIQAVQSTPTSMPSGTTNESGAQPSGNDAGGGTNGTGGGSEVPSLTTMSVNGSGRGEDGGTGTVLATEDEGWFEGEVWLGLGRQIGVSSAVGMSRTRWTVVAAAVLLWMSFSSVT